MDITAKLVKTRNSINAHLGRGLGLGENGRINYRGCDLCDRYNALRNKLMEEDYEAWKAYCDRYGSDYRHTGHDLFA